MPATPNIILHHYASSPYAEKVRLALGLKGLAWGSVEVAPLPPRPLLAPLTGGYRRIPVMQVGADIYCDTNIILPALERLFPEPTLYPDGSAGLAKALSFDFERAIWLAAIGVRVHTADEDAPADFLRDRKEDYLYVDMSKAAMEPHAAANVQKVRAQAAWLAETLADGRPYLCGEMPGALDLGCFHAFWLMRSANAAKADTLIGFAPLRDWFERVAALGHGRPATMGGDEALALAKAADPAYFEHIGIDPDGLVPGENVSVTPDDFACVPVTGSLIAADAQEVVIGRRSPETGDLHLHFPRAGFVVALA